MPANGRPSELTSEKTDAVCVAIAEGASLSQAVKEISISRQTWYRWMDSEPELMDDYARACEWRGNFYGEQVAEIGERILSGDVAPDVGRAAADCLKWTAARMAPKQFGDRQTFAVGQKPQHMPEDLERFIEQQGLKRLIDAIPE